MKTRKEVAREFGVSRQAVWLWIKLGKIKAELVRMPTGQTIWLIPESEVERLRKEKA